jgi:hypothetical protein
VPVGLYELIRGFQTPKIEVKAMEKGDMPFQQNDEVYLLIWKDKRINDDLHNPWQW